MLSLLLLLQSGIGPPAGYQPPPPAPLTQEIDITVPYGYGVYNAGDQLYHEPVEIPQFDQRLGRLRLVKIDVTVFHAVDLFVENTGNGSCFWQWYVDAKTAIPLPGTLGTLRSEMSRVDRPWRLGAFDGTVDGFGSSGRRETFVATDVQPETIVGGPAVMPFVGTGSLLLDVQRSGTFAYDATTANAVASHLRRSAVSIHVQYVYQK